MLLADRSADIYPRLAPTMKWDTVAAHAILNAVNLKVYQEDFNSELVYNKANLLNPCFLKLKMKANGCNKVPFQSQPSLIH